MSHTRPATPLLDVLSAFARQNPLRLHMPGHKGKAIGDDFSTVFALDFTELAPTGNLYEQTGPIRLAEIQVAKYYQSADCHFLTGGSSQGMFSMLYATCQPGDAIALARGVHKSVLSACVALDLQPHFLYPPLLPAFGCADALSPEVVDAFLQTHPKVRALLVVSPHYFGVCEDIPALSKVCRRHGVTLLVDAAHGAHLPALGMPVPTAQGADMAVLSAHKTLPALGQGAYLLFGADTYTTRAREGAMLFGTSSPSYPIMASLDLARAWLEGEGKTLYPAIKTQVQDLQSFLQIHTPYLPLTTQHTPFIDPCRLTLSTVSAGQNGHEVLQFLADQHQIYCEMATAHALVAILTGADTRADLHTLRVALLDALPSVSRQSLPPLPKEMPVGEALCSPRSAWFAPSQSVPLQDAIGRICARPITPYPPGIPLLWPGEKITAQHVEFLQALCYTENNIHCVSTSDYGKECPV